MAKKTSFWKKVNFVYRTLLDFKGFISAFFIVIAIVFQTPLSAQEITLENLQKLFTDDSTAVRLKMSKGGCVLTFNGKSDGDSSTISQTYDCKTFTVHKFQSPNKYGLNFVELDSEEEGTYNNLKNRVTHDRDFLAIGYNYINQPELVEKLIYTKGEFVIGFTSIKHKDRYTYSVIISNSSYFVPLNCK